MQRFHSDFLIRAWAEFSELGVGPEFGGVLTWPNPVYPTSAA